MSIERIIAAVVDTKQLTLYREDGSTIEIPQGDPRVRGIIAQVMPVVQSGGVAEVDLTSLPNAYKEFEQKSSGFVSLWRVAKKAVKDLFSPPSEEDVTEMLEVGGTFGILPVTENTKHIVTQAAVDEILEQAEPVSSEDFKDADTTDEHTMVAVVQDPETKTKTIVPGVEAIKEQFAYAGGKGSTKGMERFLARVSKIIADRPHSVEDLLRFLEKGDLPIADDGCIVAYKRLYSHGDGIYTDPHTRLVKQRPGSYVCVAKNLVDLSRRNECSNGLHIGRRGYMGGFSGDTIMICKIAPEDVMVVPHGDPNKVRVCGYHIVERVNDKAFTAICSNRPPTKDNSEMTELLSNVIAGKHKPPFEEVRVTGQRGQGLVINKLDTKKAQNYIPEGAPGQHSNGTPVQPEEHRSLDDSENTTADPKNVAQEVSQAKQGGSRKDRALALFDGVKKGNVQDAKDLLHLKLTSKVGWTTLGLLASDAERIEELARLTQVSGAKKTKATPAPTPAPVKEQASVAKAKGERAQKIEAFEKVMKDESLNHSVRFNAGQDLLAFRKRSKVSWERLGRPDLTDDGITKYINSIPTEAPKKAPEPKAAPKVQTPKAKEPDNKVTKPETLSETTRRLFNEKKWAELAIFKKARKKSWSALGFTSQEEAEVKLHLGD